MEEETETEIMMGAGQERGRRHLCSKWVVISVMSLLTPSTFTRFGGIVMLKRAYLGYEATNEVF